MDETIMTEANCQLCGGCGMYRAGTCPKCGGTGSPKQKLPLGLIEPRVNDRPESPLMVRMKQAIEACDTASLNEALEALDHLRGSAEMPLERAEKLAAIVRVALMKTPKSRGVAASLDEETPAQSSAVQKAMERFYKRVEEVDAAVADRATPGKEQHVRTEKGAEVPDVRHQDDDRHRAVRSDDRMVPEVPESHETLADRLVADRATAPAPLEQLIAAFDETYHIGTAEVHAYRWKNDLVRLFAALRSVPSGRETEKKS